MEYSSTAVGDLTLLDCTIIASAPFVFVILHWLCHCACGVLGWAGQMQKYLYGIYVGIMHDD